MQQNSEYLTGVVLCGGKASRMGNTNKGLVSYRGRWLFEYALDNLSDICPNVVINTNTDEGIYQQIGFSTIDDGEFSYLGPLAGIYAGLSRLDSELVAFAPCDQLSLPAHVYKSLLLKAEMDGGAYAVANGDIHPTCCVLSSDLAPRIKTSLQNNQLKLTGWMQDNAQAIDFSGVEFSNINQLTE